MCCLRAKFTSVPVDRYAICSLGLLICFLVSYVLPSYRRQQTWCYIYRRGKIL
uniref:Uncharacterized protein n=1 Tax=Anguilla anguilla TaxID=7936 RepID=A0A0E9SMU9_ANGAN